MNGQIPDQGFWSSGSLEHLIQIAIPIVIWVIIIYFGHRAFKSGIKLFHQDGDSQVEKLQPLPESEESLREVVAYSGFDPDIYGSLPERDRMIIMYRYGFVDGDSWTYDKISELYDVSSERIRQIERAALCKLSETTTQFSALSSFLPSQFKS